MRSPGRDDAAEDDSYFESLDDDEALSVAADVGVIGR